MKCKPCTLAKRTKRSRTAFTSALLAGAMLGSAACNGKASGTSNSGAGGSGGHSAAAGAAGAGQAGSGSGGSGGSGGSTAVAFRWYQSCGYPVCGNPALEDAALGPACTEEQEEGKPCSEGSANCDPALGCGVVLMCADADPTLSPGGCPISRLAFKHDVHYLTAAERAGYVAELLGLELATYRYRLDSDQRTHLGFIIDDIEPSIAADSKRDRVDLYSYASMAVAAIQEQQTQLDQLKAEVHELRAELAHLKTAASATAAP